MKKKRTSFTNMLIVLFWITFFRPLILERISSVIDNIWYISHFVIFIILIFYRVRTVFDRLVKRREKNFSYAYLFMILFFIWNFGCVAGLAADHITEYILEVIHVIEIVFVFRCIKADKIEDNINIIGGISTFYIWANFVSMIAFKSGIITSHIGSSSARVQWLLGSKNSIPIYILLFMMFVQAKTDYKHKKTAYLTCSIGLISVIIAGSNGLKFMGGSSAGILASIGLFAMFIYVDVNEKNKKVPFFLNTKIDVIGIIVVNIIVLSDSVIPFINDLIVPIFHKTLDYSGRRSIWEFALLNISKSPIVGHGASKYGLNIYYESYLAGPTYTTYVYNMLLRLWLRYGIVSVVLYFLILLNLRIGSDRLTNIMMAGIVGICIFGLMNEVDFFAMFIPMIILEEMAIYNSKRKRNITVVWNVLG